MSIQSRAGVVRGTLVGGCSALFTAAAHSAGGAGADGVSVLMMALVCATVGAAISTVNFERYSTTVAALTGAVLVAQSLGHVTLASHHGLHTLPAPMLVAHTLAAAALAALIALAEHLVDVCGTVLCWMRLVVLHRGRPRTPVLRERAVVLVRTVLRSAGLGMRAPPSAVG